MRPFAILFALLESASLGLGVAFLCLGWPRARHLADGAPALARAAFASIAWGLISWWAHGHLHRHAGVPASSADLTGPLILEYAFHGMLILGGLIVAAAILRLPRPVSRAAAASPAPTAALSGAARARVTWLSPCRRSRAPRTPGRLRPASGKCTLVEVGGAGPELGKRPPRMAEGRRLPLDHQPISAHLPHSLELLD